jgi:hypothetical protein
MFFISIFFIIFIKNGNMECYEKLLEWVEEEQNKFPDDDLEISQLVAYSTLELVKRKIIELKNEEL